MKLYIYGILLITGIALGAGIALKRNSETEISATVAAPKPKRFGLRPDIAYLSDPGSYDFFKKINSGKCDFKQELAKLFAYDIVRNSLEEGKICLLLEQWGYTSPRVALSEIGSLPFNDRKRYSNYIFSGWAQRNPEELAHYYRENRDQLYESSALNLAVLCWAESSPKEAIKFLSSLNAKEEKESLLSLLNGRISTDSDKYKMLSTLLPERQSKDPEVLTALMEKWFTADPAASTEWMNNLSPEQQESLSKYKGLGTLPPITSLVELSQKDPESISAQIAAAPVWFQDHAWAAVLCDMSKKKGILEMFMWQKEHVPQKQAEAIMSSPFFEVPIFSIPGENREEFEKTIAFLHEENKDEPSGHKEFIDGPYNVYLQRFSARFPQEMLSFEQTELGYDGDDSRIIATWMYDDPEKAELWLTKLPGDEKWKQRSLRLIKANSPVGAIDKKHE